MVAVGFVLSHEQFPPQRLIDLGIRAEQAGFDMVWTSDHFHPWMANEGQAGQAWITLAALGQRLGRIPMGTGVTCPTYRYHPSIVAQAFASLAVLYPGRVFLGVGSGEAVNEKAATGRWGKYQERGERLVEAVTLIRKLWAGGIVTFRGKYYQTEKARLYTLPQQPVPLYIAAAGPQSMHLAGQHGDGLITNVESALKPQLKDAFNRGAQAAGKNPQIMPINAESFVFVGNRDEAAQAAEKWRFEPKTAAFVDNPDPRDIQRQADASIPLDKVMEKWIIGSDAGIHIDAIRKLADGGVTNVFIHSGQEDQERVIDFYGREVLPQLQHQTMQAAAETV